MQASRVLARLAHHHSGRIDLALAFGLVAKQAAVAGIAVLIRGTIRVAAAGTSHRTGNTLAVIAHIAHGARLVVITSRSVRQGLLAASASGWFADRYLTRIAGLWTLHHRDWIDLAGVAAGLTIIRAVAKVVVVLAGAVAVGLAFTTGDSALAFACFAGGRRCARVRVSTNDAIRDTFAAGIHTQFTSGQGTCAQARRGTGAGARAQAVVAQDLTLCRGLGADGPGRTAAGGQATLGHTDFARSAFCEFTGRTCGAVGLNLALRGAK